LVVPSRCDGRGVETPCRRRKVPTSGIERNARDFAALGRGQSKKARGRLKLDFGGLDPDHVRLNPDLGRLEIDQGGPDSDLLQSDADVLRADQARFQSTEDGARLEKVRVRLKD
jgi:hypothetical protein